MIRAVVFDLYGTLLRIADPAFQRELAHLDRAALRDWVAYQREVLLVEPFGTHADFVAAVLRRVRPGADEAEQRRVEALLERELASVEPLPGVLSLLSFLDRRGFALGLITNSASPYREPFDRLGLAELFDAILFSCDERARKPEPRLYADACARLGVEPGETLMVGDSLPNDVSGPRAAGMEALLVGESRRAAGVPRAALLGWMRFSEQGGLEPLVAAGERLSLGGRAGVLGALEPLGDDEQGRYNLVASSVVAWEDGSSSRIFLKRFLHPESAWVEVFTHQLLAELGFETYPVGVIEKAEPIFIAAEVEGRKLGDTMGDVEITPALAREVGRHICSGYLLPNADLRPRNAFLAGTADAPRLVMVDHEHCLMNLALDSGGLNMFDRPGLEALGRDLFEFRVARRVLTPATMRRARRQFFETRGRPELAAAFQEGWLEVHGRAQLRRDRIAELFAARLEAAPPLVAGTQAYRRVLTRFDLEDLLERIDADPVAACKPCL
jgi:putative hydrolase of the HAD superfamily